MSYKRSFSDIVYGEYVASQSQSQGLQIPSQSQGLQLPQLPSQSQGLSAGGGTGGLDDITVLLGIGDSSNVENVEEDDEAAKEEERKRRRLRVVGEGLGAGCLVENRGRRGGGRVGEGGGRVVDRKDFALRFVVGRGYEGDEAIVERERICYRMAREAREEFKKYRDRIEGDGLSGRGNSGGEAGRAEKYERRLENNRRSAAVSKVYTEVLDKEKSMAIRSLAKRNKLLEDNLQNLLKSTKEYEASMDAVTRENTELNEEVRKLKEENAKMAAERNKVTGALVSKGFAERGSNGSTPSGGSLKCSEGEVDEPDYILSQTSQGVSGR